MNFNLDISNELEKWPDLFSLALDLSHDLITIVDEAGRMVWANKAWKDFFASADIRYKTKPFEMIHPDDLLKVTKAFENMLNEHKDITNLEYRYRNLADESYWYFETSAKEIESSKRRLFYLSAHDATARKNAELKRIESELKYKNILDYSQMAITFFELDGKITLINKRAAKNIGKEVQELIGTCVYDLFPKEQANSLIKKHQEVIRSKQSSRLEIKVKLDDKDGWYLSDVHPIIDDKGEVTDLQAITLDITERKQIENEKFEAIFTFEEFFNNIGSGVCIWKVVDDGSDFIIKDINGSGAKLSKVHREDVVGKRAREVFPGIDNFGILKIIEKVWRSGIAETFPVRLYSDVNHEAYFENKIFRLPSGLVAAVYEDRTTEVAFQDKLSKSEQRYQSLVNNINGMIYRAACDQENQWTTDYLNSYAYQITGYHRDYFVKNKNSWFELIHPDDRPRIFKEALPLQTNNLSIVQEYRIIRADGLIIWVEDRKQSILENGKLKFIDGIVFDITDSKKMIKRQSYAEKIGRVGSFEWDVKTEKIWLSEQNYKILGLRVEDGLPSFKQVQNLLHPKDRDFVKKCIKETLEEDRPYELEYRIVLQNGELKWVKSNGEVIRDRDSEAIKFFGTMLDITSRKKAEKDKNLLISRLKAMYQLSTYQDLSTTDEFNQQVIAGMEEMITEQYVFLAYYLVDKKAFRIFSSSCKTFDLHIDKSVFLRKAILLKEAIMLNDCSLDMSCTQWLPKGHPPIKRLLCTSTSKFVDIKDENSVIAILANKEEIYTKEDVIYLEAYLRGLQDILNIRLAKEKKREMQKQLFLSSKLVSIGELAAGVGHEINNPMAIILGNNEIINLELQKLGLKNKSIQRSLEIQGEAISRVIDIVNGLRKHARSDKNVHEIISVHESIETSISLLKSIYEKENIIFRREFSDTEICIKGNLNKFQQIIINLFSNAKDAMLEKNGGEISVKTETANDQAILHISDQGVGILKDNLDKIFDSFYTSKGEERGTGLGLSITLSLLREMGGDITVDSIVGEGTKFRITWPLVVGSEKVIKAKAPETHERKKLSGKVLIVDDEEHITELLDIQLSKFGLVSETTVKGELALNMLKENKHKYDVLITDLKMPEMSGYELIKRAQEQNLLTNTSIIIMTGGLLSDSSEQQEELMKDNSVRVIQKPFDRHALYETFEAILSTKGKS